MTIPKLKAVIVDDEPLNIETLDKLITSYCAEVIVVARCQNPLDAVGLVNDLRPDIVFLDITMPEINGFEFLNRFQSIKFKTIFTTAYSEYAVKAIKYAAFDFLLKPIEKDELKEAISRARASMKETAPSEVAHHSGTKTNLALPTSEGFSFINIHDILYCKSDNSYTDYILKEGKKIVVSRGLKETADMLEKHGFFRIHQSYLVNGKYIKKFNKHYNIIVVANGDELPVALRKKEEFLQFVAKL